MAVANVLASLEVRIILAAFSWICTTKHHVQTVWDSNG